MAMRILALIVIFLAATFAWVVLSATLVVRTQQADTEQRSALGSLWGPPQTQCVPEFSYPIRKSFQSLPLSASRIAVDLALDQRRKGLRWYNTYRVSFSGAYRVVNTSTASQLRFALPLPADNGVYDDVRVLVDGRPIANTTEGGIVRAAIPVSPGRVTEVSVAYQSRGIGTWSYRFGIGSNTIRNFDLVMRTDFKAIDFPAGTLAPTNERQTADGWELQWRYRDLVAGVGIGMGFPERLQPGQLAQRITMWAPLSLLFYFFVMFIITTLRRIDLHPMNYFFLAAAFFSFHLLFAYTVDRISISSAFLICSVVSMFLTISYLRLVVGLRFAAVEAGLAQFFYLILFSLALFNEGYSGLAITIGSIVTLFVTMQLTARVDWGERFAGQLKPAAAGLR
jgi:hypothetical protein